MRSVQLQNYGSATQGITVIDLPEPSPPAEGEILVGMAYAPVNLNDILVIQGVFPVHPPLPSPVGNEGVGRVLAVGKGVVNLSVGDSVVLPLYSFTWRERMLVRASSVIAVTQSADLQQLAMLRINGVTASLLLSEYVDLTPGDWIIQNAGNSAVARTVSAIAKSRGLKTINLVRRPDAIELAMAAGADAAFVDNEDAAGRVKAMVGERGVKLGLDGVGGAAVGRLAAMLDMNGTIVSYATLGGEVVSSVGVLDVIFKNLTYRGFYLDKPEYDAAIPAIISHTADLVATGDLHVPIAAIYSIENVVQAIEHVQRGGKALLEFEGWPTE